MQELLIDWDAPRMTCVEVSRSGEGILGLQMHQFVAPEDLAGASRGRELGEWLARELSLKQVTATNWTVVLPRDRVTLRRLELPGIPESEVAMVVPFQMASQLGSAPEQMVVDFLPSGPGAVLAVSLPVEMLAQIKIVANQCGASVSRILVSSCLVSTTKPESAKRALVLWADEHRIEAVFSDGGTIQAASCRRRNSTSELTTGELAGEIRRLLMNTDPVIDPVAIFTVGSAVTLSNELGGKLNLEVTPVTEEDLAVKGLKGKVSLDQLESLAPIGQLALLGLKGAAGERERIDFLAPRKATEKKDRRLQYAIAGSIAAVIFLALGSWMWNARLADLNEEIATLGQSIRDGESFIKAREQVGTAAGKIEKHIAQQVEMSSHFSEMLQTLPGTERLFLTSYTLIPLTGEYRARVVATGLAKRRLDVELFFEQLTQRGLRVKPSPIDEETRRDRDYPVEFKLELDIPSKPVLAAKQKVEETRTSRAGASGGGSRPNAT